MENYLATWTQTRRWPKKPYKLWEDDCSVPFSGAKIEIVSKSAICLDGMRIDLNRPVELYIRQVGGYYMINFPEAHIYVAEVSRSEALTMFDEEFAFAWENYAEADDTRLHPLALRIKKWLLANGERVH